jgi:hypothetical protein
MTNPKDYQTYNREVRQDSYNDANGHTHTNVTRTEETVNNGVVKPNADSYRDGYVSGRVSERSYQEENLAVRDNNNAASGLVIGLLLTSLVGLAAGTWFFLNQRNDAPAPVIPNIVVPRQPDAKPAPAAKPAPEARQAPKKETTIIERTRDVLVPVPQKQAPAPQPVAPAPNINITVPNSEPKQPAAQEAPSTQTAPTQPESKSDRTPAQGESTETGTTSSSSPQNAGADSPDGSAQ